VVALGCRNETSRGDRIIQRLDANHEGKHHTILEETDPREHIEGRATPCAEEKWEWVDLHCDVGRKLTFLDRFLCSQMGSGPKAVSEPTDNYPEVYTRNEPFSELRTSSKKSLLIFQHQCISKHGAWLIGELEEDLDSSRHVLVSGSIRARGEPIECSWFDTPKNWPNDIESYSLE
jgi:hypothetical protein